MGDIVKGCPLYANDVADGLASTDGGYAVGYEIVEKMFGGDDVKVKSADCVGKRGGRCVGVVVGGLVC